MGKGDFIMYTPLNSMSDLKLTERLCEFQKSLERKRVDVSNHKEAIKNEEKDMKKIEEEINTLKEELVRRYRKEIK